MRIARNSFSRQRQLLLQAPYRADLVNDLEVAPEVPHKKLRGGVVQMVAPDAIPKSAAGKILRRVLVQRNKAGEFDPQE